MKAVLRPLWLRVKPYLTGRNESARARTAPSANPMREPDDSVELVDLRRQLQDFETAVRYASASPDVLRHHFRLFGATLARTHARLNESEAQLNAGLHAIRATRKIFDDSKERIALTLAPDRPRRDRADLVPRSRRTRGRPLRRPHRTPRRGGPGPRRGHRSERRPFTPARSGQRRLRRFAQAHARSGGPTRPRARTELRPGQGEGRRCRRQH